MSRRVRFHRIDPSGAGNLFPRDTLLSPALGSSMWEDCPVLALLADPSIGQFYADNWLNVTPATNAIPGWTTTTATSGAVTLDATDGLKVDAGAVTANQGVNLQRTRVNCVIAANKPVWLEAELKFTGQATPKGQILFGLAAASTTLIASGAVGTTDKVAFDGVYTSGGALQADVSKSGTNTTSAAAATITNNGFLTLGIRAKTTGVEFWVNHVKAATITTNIPTAALTPSLVVQANATDQPIVFVEWLKVASIF